MDYEVEQKTVRIRFKTIEAKSKPFSKSRDYHSRINPMKILGKVGKKMVRKI